VLTKLLIKTGDGKQAEMECEPVMTIGRDSNSSIMLSEKLVSRNHAMIRRLGKNDFYLIDVGSSNGSYVNGRRIATPQQLKDGDEIKIGETTMVFSRLGEATTTATTEDVDDRTTLSTHNEIRRVAILVADIRGYTSLSESVPIGPLTRFMAHWFRAVGDAVEREGGVVDKFIGDCVYARWELDDDLSTTIQHTLAAALAIYQATRGLHASHTELGDKLDIGVGINTGHAAVGIGLDNTALGDAVNLTFRLESASKEMGKDVVMSRSAYEVLPETCWSGRESEIKVKGKAQPVAVCGLTWAEVAQAVEGAGQENTTLTRQT